MGELLEGLGAKGSWPFLYQGKEYVEAFGYNGYDFHARGYNAFTGRFDGVDAVDHYGMSGYAGMGNNPVSMIDPDGNNPIAIGFMVGIFASSIGHAIKGTMPKSVGDFLRPGIIGGVSGGIGSSVAAATNAWGTVGSGFAAGAAGGFAGGGLNSISNGNNFLKGALTGALTGGLLGAGLGILESSIAKKSISEILLQDPMQNGTDQFTQEELRNYVSDKFGDVDFVEKELRTKIFLATKENLPDGYQLKDGLIANSKGNIVGGLTRPYKPWFGKSSSNIYIPGGLKGYSYPAGDLAYLVIGHEMIHSYHYSTVKQFSSVYSERSAYSWNLAIGKNMKFPEAVIRNFRLQPIQSFGGWTYPANYSWRLVPFIQK